MRPFAGVKSFYKQLKSSSNAVLSMPILTGEKLQDFLCDLYNGANLLSEAQVSHFFSKVLTIKNGSVKVSYWEGYNIFCSKYLP